MENSTQNKAILAYLRQGKSITPMDALRVCGCFRLSARIHDLRALGHNVSTDLISVNGKRVASYKLIK